MNLNLDFSAVNRILRGLLAELRQKRLWPVALLLLVAIVAVPVVLLKSPKPTAEAQAPAPVPPPASGTAIPAISVQSTPSATDLKGSAHDPFSPAAGSGVSSTGSSATAANAVSTAVGTAQNAVSALGGSGSSTSTATGSAPTTSSGAAPSSPSTSPPSITGNAKPKPIQTGLSSTQAYDVALSTTNSAGGVDTIDPLVRLSVFPSDQQPQLVELGVLQGGSRVLFALLPGTVVQGPGSCIPGPLDCEILSLAQDQTESVSTRTGSIGGSAQSLFAITSISVNNYSSSAAANRARRAQSSDGSALLSGAGLPALSLFQYEPSLGSVVDLRNLTVGG